MADRSHEDVVMCARIAAAERWARTTDRAAATRPAREAQLARYEREVDPQGQLSAPERRERAEQLRRANMMRLSRLAAQKRAQARERRRRAS